MSKINLTEQEKELNEEINLPGFTSAEVSPGIFIQTAEDIISEQKTWEDTDDSKNMDFTCCKYWVTADNGVTPEGFDTLEEFLKEYGFLFEDNSYV